MKWDVLVVGAGPTGSFVAKTIASSGFSTLLVEEHPRVGKPVQCAGLISPRAMKLTGLEHDIVLNKVRGIRVFSPFDTKLEAESGRVFSLVVDRAELDRRLAEKAQSAGAFLLTNTRITGLEQVAGGYRATAQKGRKKMSIYASLVIGADGSNSRVAKWLDLACDIPKAVMYAAEVVLPRDNTDSIDVFLGQGLAPGWFGWIIPVDKNTCRVGTGYAFVQPEYSAHYYFQKITEAFPESFRGLKIIQRTGGMVPLGPLPKIFAPHAMLVGDAACQTKPISGGGIFTGLTAAQLCAETAIKALAEDNLSEKRIAVYQELWQAKIGLELSSAMSYRKSFLEFTDREIDTLLRFLNRPRWLKTILDYGDIDYPSLLASKLHKLHPLVRTLFRNVRHITTLPFQVSGARNDYPTTEF